MLLKELLLPPPLFNQPRCRQLTLRKLRASWRKMQMRILMHCNGKEPTAQQLWLTVLNLLILRHTLFMPFNQRMNAWSISTTSSHFHCQSFDSFIRTMHTAQVLFSQSSTNVLENHFMIPTMITLIAEIISLIVSFTKWEETFLILIVYLTVLAASEATQPATLLLTLI